jgi:hypothetical protein
MRGNTVTLEMPMKRGKMGKTIPLYQYDYGQKLLFSGVELPDFYEVHFSNELHGESTTVIGDSTGAEIPESYLATGKPVYVWFFAHTEVSDGETEFQGVVPVIKRAQPSDVDPTPTERTVIAQAIAALNEAYAEMAAYETLHVGKIKFTINDDGDLIFHYTDPIPVEEDD